MPIPFPTYPIINGLMYSFASIEAFFNGFPIAGIVSINYKSSLKPGIARGTGAQKMGRTIGDHDADCDFEMYLLDAMAFIATLGNAGGFGFGVGEFIVRVGYQEIFSEVPMPPTLDVILGARVTELAASNQQGTDPSKRKFTTDVMDVLHNGVSIVPPKPGIAAI